MKACLICQSGQDQVSLNRIPVSMEGAPWGDFLICGTCFEMLGGDEVKSLVRVAYQEKSFEPNNVILSDEGTEEEAVPGSLELPVNAAVLQDSVAFARGIGEKLGQRLWQLHKRGVSAAVTYTALTPDGEGGYVFEARFGRAPKN